MAAVTRPKGGTAGSDDPVEGLIREGMVSYPEAVVALREFQRIVQDRCEQVVSDRLGELSKAMGVELHDKDIADYPTLGRHTQVGWDGKGVWLYVKLALKFGTLYFGVGWAIGTSADSKISVAAVIGLSDRQAYDMALRKFKKTLELRVEAEPRYREVWLTEQVPVKDAHLFQTYLNDVLTRFIGAWQKIGGVKGLS
jgi:hypothetical protein